MIDVHVRVQVVDSSANMRYLILPWRPEGNGNMCETGLATLVTQDYTVGAAEALSPELTGGNPGRVGLSSGTKLNGRRFGGAPPFPKLIPESIPG